MGRVRTVMGAVAGVVAIVIAAAVCAQEHRTSLGQTVGLMSSVHDLQEMATRSAPAGYGFRRGNAILGALIDPGERIRFRDSFKGGVRYLIISAADRPVHNLDLSVYDSRGRRLYHESDYGRRPRMFFTPPADGEYTISAVHAEGDETAVCTIAILQPDGVEIASTSIVTASQRLFDTKKTLDEKLGVRLLDGGDLWCLYGSALPHGYQTVVRTPLPGNERLILYTVADNNCIDCDLFVQGGLDGVDLRDINPDPSPLLFYQGVGGDFTIKAANMKAEGPSLLLTLIVMED